MKVRWDFFFETRGFEFNRVHTFRGVITDEHVKIFGLAAGGEFTLIVEPHAECKFPPAEQSGMLRLLLPGRESETKDFATWLVVSTAEKISFQHHGELKVHPGLITGERIAETPEEAEEVREEPYFAHAHLVEADPTPVFDGLKLTAVPGSPELLRAMRQYNAALRADNPIDRFLGLFKILEDLFAGRSEHGDLANALRSARPLYDVAYDELTFPVGDTRRQPTRDDFNNLVGELVAARDQCAHLRSAQGLGIAHGDPRVATEVAPLLEPLRVLSHGTIQRVLGRPGPGGS